MRPTATAMDGGNAGFAGAKTGRWTGRRWRPDAGLRPCAPIARNLSSRSSFALYSTYSLIHRHCLRPRIVRRVVRHDPRPVHPGGPVNNGSFRRAIGAIQAAAATPAILDIARCARKTKTQKPKLKNQNSKTKTQKPKLKIQKPKTKNQKKTSGRRPPKFSQIAAVFPGPFVPARCLAKPIASFG